MKLSFDFLWAKGETATVLAINILDFIGKDFITLFYIKIFKFVIGVYLER
jgi:hypothetical protein